MDYEKVIAVMESLYSTDRRPDGLSFEVKESISRAARAGTLSAHDFFHNKRLGLNEDDTPFAQFCAARYNPYNAAGLSLEQHQALTREVLVDLLDAVSDGGARRRQGCYDDGVLQCYLGSEGHGALVDDQAVARFLERFGLDVAGEYGGRRAASTSLFLAARLGRPELVRSLLRAGAPATADYQAMWAAVRDDNVPVLELLLGAGAGDRADHMARVYSAAAADNKPGCLALLAGAEDFPGPVVEEALGLAIHNRAWPCVEILMSRPDTLPDLGRFFGAGRGFSALKAGIIWSDQGAQQALMATLSSLLGAGLPRPALSGYIKGLYEFYSGAPKRASGPFARNEPSSRLRRALLGHLLEELEIPPPDGLLEAAIRAGAPAADMELICAQAPGQINEPNEDGRPPLLALLSKASRPGAKVTGPQVKALLEAGADPNVSQVNGTDALTMAKRYCPEQVALLLEEYGARPQLAAAGRYLLRP